VNPGVDVDCNDGIWRRGWSTLKKAKGSWGANVETRESGSFHHTRRTGERTCVEPGGSTFKSEMLINSD